MLYNPELIEFTDRLRADWDCNEMAAAIFLSSAFEITDLWIGTGEADSVSIPIRQIIARGLRAASSQLILLHTHPSGDPRPSHQDRIATKRLRTTLMTHDIRLYDHIILAQKRTFSFRLGGLL